MKTRLPLLLLALLLHAQAPATPAQTPPQAQASAEAERAELERKAVGLVGEALAEAQSLKLVENRLRAQTTAARLLWPRDQKAARTAFKAAADGIAELNADVDPEDPQFYNTAQLVGQFRSELANAAAPFDASLALDFLRATRPTYTDAMVASGFYQPWQEQMLEMNVAAFVAAQEPQRALELAEESLGRGGVTTALLNVVRQLKTKEPAAASKLAADIVHRLRPEDLREQNEAAAVAQQLLALSRPAERPQASPVANSTGPMMISVYRPVPEAGAPLLDEQTRRELAEKVLTAVVGASPNQGGGYNLFYALQALLPELDKFAPTRAAALRRQAEEMERIVNPYQQRIRPYEQVMQTGTAEAVLEAARKAPAEVRDQLYMNAVWKIFNDGGGDPERVRQILENISNPQQRAQVRRELEQRAQWRDVQQGGFVEARQAVSRLKTPEERVQALLQIAGRASAGGNAETARQALEEARGIVESQTRGQQQFGYRLQVANAYAQLDPDTAFELVETTVARLDALLDAAETLDGFGMDAFREGELRSQNGYIWGELVNQCAQALAPLARSDFERAVAAAKKFRRPEARIAAQLSLAQSLLGSYAKPEFRGRTSGGITVITK